MLLVTEQDDVISSFDRINRDDDDDDDGGVVLDRECETGFIMKFFVPLSFRHFLYYAETLVSITNSISGIIKARLINKITQYEYRYHI